MSSEPVRSSKERAPRVGDVCSYMYKDNEPWTIRNLDTRDDLGDFQATQTGSGIGLVTRRDWDAGRWRILESGPAPAESADAVDWSRFIPTEALADTGPKTLTKGDVWAFGAGERQRAVVRVDRHGWATVLAGFVFGVDQDNSGFSSGDRARRSQLIRHADGRWADGYGPDGPITAKPAKVASDGRQLAGAWIRMGAVRKAWVCFRCGARESLFFHHEHKAACEACAEAAGVFADAKPVAAPLPEPPKPAPQSACGWTCSGDIHGPRCPKFVAPSVLRARQEVMANAAKSGAVVGRYGQRITKPGYAEWSALQHGLEPDGQKVKAPRIRDIYLSGDATDPEWVAGSEVR